MKILLTITKSSKTRAGVEIFNDHLKKAFPDLKILDYKTLERAENLREPGNLLLKEPMYAKRLCEWFLKNYEELNPEAIFTNGMYGWALDRKKTKCPTINIQHGTYAGFAKAAMKLSLNYFRIRYVYSHFEKLSARKSGIIVSNSEFTKNNVKNYYRLDSRVIYNAIDTDVIKPLEKQFCREKLNLPGDKKIAVFVGRPDYTKGFDVVEKLSDQFRDILFLCVLGPKTNVSQHGNMRIFFNVPHNKLNLFYSAADFSICSSRFEGFGYAPLEALACNIPVIANRTGIFNDMEIEGSYIASKNHPRQYAELIKNLPEKTDSRKTIEKEFSFDRFQKNYKNLIL